MSKCPPKIVVPNVSNVSSATLMARQLVRTSGSLRGSTGPSGATGSTGATGATGPTGAASNVIGTSPAFVQYGSKPISGILENLDSSNFTADFPRPFQGIPTVIVSVAGVPGFTASLKFVSAYSFTGFYTNTSKFPMEFRGNIQWVAIGALN